ncbi:MAG TPA: TAXI family TRAP transporter solute-binding subunit [Lacipirellulaceae bacterium]|nr:TAXI family TRAP transporter solute-binding subunit [Lacipirellulaceae bacterium]
MHARWFGIVAVLFAAFTSPAARAAEPNWPESLTIVTASPGGTYYAYGEGLAKILIRVLGMPVSMRPTEGPSQNIQLIEAGEAQLGFVTMGVTLQAWNGTGDWTGGRQYRSIRALFPMYDTPFHFVVLNNSPIRSIASVSGKRVGVGPQGGTAGAFVPRMLAALNIAASPAFGSWADLAAELQAQSVDVLGAAVGAPFPAVAELDAKKAVRFVPLSPNEVLSLRLAIPELTPSLIPAGTYPSLMRNYETVGLYNFAVAHQDLPTDLAYRIVDAVFSNHQQMIEVHPAAAATVPENFVHNTFLPYHSGAARYFGNLVAADAARGD